MNYRVRRKSECQGQSPLALQFADNDLHTSLKETMSNAVGGLTVRRGEYGCGPFFLLKRKEIICELLSLSLNGLSNASNFHLYKRIDDH